MPISRVLAREMGDSDRLKLFPFPADGHTMDVSNIALQGLEQANTQLEAAATAIATAGSDSSSTGNVDVVDLSAEMVALMSAQNAFSVNLATLKTADQMQQSLVDIKA